MQFRLVSTSHYVGDNASDLPVSTSRVLGPQACTSHFFFMKGFGHLWSVL